MPASITPLLADRLDISEERARSLLQTMLQELRRRTESDSVRFPELGTFREENGTLTFEPSPSLRRRVNHQYEGLSAEELMPPEPVPEAEPADEEVEEEPIPTLDPIDEDAPSEQASSAAYESEPSPQGRTVDSFSIISIVLAVLLLLGVGWFVLDQTNVWSPSPNVAAEQGPGTSDTADADQTDRISGVRTQDDQDTTAQDTTAQTTGGWAIVVASRDSRAAAEEMADEYKSRYDSVEVIAGTVDNRTWYRVAIGAYDSEASAERALDENASALPSGAWTHRLR